MNNRQFLFVCAVAFINPWFVSSLTQTTVHAAENKVAEQTPHLTYSDEKFPIVDPLNPEVEVIPGEGNNSEIITAETSETSKQTESTVTETENQTTTATTKGSESMTQTSETEEPLTTTTVQEDDTKKQPIKPKQVVKPKIKTVTTEDNPKVKKVIKKRVVKNETEKDDIPRIVRKRPKYTTNTVKKKENNYKNETVVKEKLFLSEDFFKKTTQLKEKPSIGGNSTDEINTNLGKLAGELSGVCLYGMKRM